MIARVIVALALVAGCKDDPNCKQAVDHVFALMLVGPKPSADEQRVIDHVKDQTLGRCNDEGLSVAQRDCILAAKSLTEQTFLTCPALVARPPSWISAPIGRPDLVGPGSAP
jgi:hypothetical protein